MKKSRLMLPIPLTASWTTSATRVISAIARQESIAILKAPSLSRSLRGPSERLAAAASEAVGRFGLGAHS